MILHLLITPEVIRMKAILSARPRMYLATPRELDELVDPPTLRLGLTD